MGLVRLLLILTDEFLGLPFSFPRSVNPQTISPSFLVDECNIGPRRSNPAIAATVHPSPAEGNLFLQFRGVGSP